MPFKRPDGFPRRLLRGGLLMARAVPTAASLFPENCCRHPVLSDAGSESFLSCGRFYTLRRYKGEGRERYFLSGPCSAFCCFAAAASAHPAEWNDCRSSAFARLTKLLPLRILRNGTGRCLRNETRGLPGFRRKRCPAGEISRKIRLGAFPAPGFLL